MRNLTSLEMGNSSTQTAHPGTQEPESEFTGTTEVPGQSCKAFLARPDEVEVFWPLVVDHLALATPHSEGEIEPEDMLPELIKGEMQLWFSVEDRQVTAAMVTQIIPYPRKKVLRILSIGGEGMARWMKHFPMIEKFAKQIGCSSIEAWGRKGWLRALPDWKCSYHIFTKEIK